MAAALIVCIAGSASGQTQVLAIAAGVDDSIISILDYGATPDTVNPNDNDGVAIQAAIDAAAAQGGGVVFVPRGRYRVVSQTLLLARGVSIIGEGYDPGGGSDIIRTGTVGYLIDPVASFSGMIAMLKLGSTGSVIDADNTNSMSVRDALLSPGTNAWGLTSTDSTFDLRLDNIWMLGNALNQTNYGLHLYSHATATGLNLNGLKEGIRIGATGAGGGGFETTIVGLRCEVCEIGIRSGIDINGALGNASFSLIGASFESNGTAIYARGACNLQEVRVQAYEGAHDYQVTDTGGIILDGVSNSTFSNVVLTPVLTRAKPSLILQNVNNCTFRSILAQTMSGNGWSTSTSVLHGTGNSFENCNLPLNPADTLTGDLLIKAVRTHSLAGIDYLNPAAQGKNVRGINVAVAEAATSKAIAFLPGFSGGQVVINTIVAANTGGATLADDEYFYLPTAVTPAGEAAGTPERSVTVAGADNSVNIVFVGTADRLYKRRVYRGTVTGQYDGYFELGLNVDSFSDIGQAFTVTGQTPPDISHNNDNSMLEPDANYAVTVTPNWDTTWWVTNKATTGFTIHFGTAAPASATVDYVMVR